MTKRAWALTLLVGLYGCGGDTGPVDSGSDGEVTNPDGGGGRDDAGPACERDSDCDDGLFCTGGARCDPARADAAPDGCVRAMSPCGAGQICEEAMAACRDDACSDGPMMNGDGDGDGDPRPSCGGTDCDDEDARRYGTAQEVCDAEGLDEDCDTSTIHDPVARDGDRDGDGFIAVACFNRRDDGGENRGTDCDDARATINTSGVEACDGRDNDCDTRIDEGVLETYYRDVDGDNFGDGSMTMMECTAPTGWVLRGEDCDDRDGAINPAASEVCDGVDNNCSGTADDRAGGCACTDGAEQPCGPPMAQAGVGICRRSTQRCVSGTWPMECPGAVYPRLMGGTPYDPCGMGDEDCDGVSDEDGRLPFYLDADRDGFGDPAMRMDFCPGDEGSSYVDNDDDCDDSNGMVNPSAAEICDGIDNDCSGGPMGGIDDVPGGCGCSLGDTRPCGTDVGRCSAGSQTCTSAGTWGPCSGVLPRAETCDGGDADCDARTDEDFDCVQSTTASGMTMCGNPGSRRCSASCTWADAAFTSPESAATCDYCDDSGMGLGEEVPFATSMGYSDVDRFWSAYGTARVKLVVPLLWAVNDAHPSGVGGVYAADTVVIGYSDTYLEASVTTVATAGEPVMGGWALVVLPEGAASHIGSSSMRPDGVRGWAAQWSFSTFVGIGLRNDADSVCFYELLSGTDRAMNTCFGVGFTSPPSWTHQNGPATTSVTQSLRLRITPDDVSTPQDETAMELTAPTLMAACDNGTSAPCGMTVSPGDRFEVGITAMGGSNGADVERPRIQVTSYDSCP